MLRSASDVFSKAAIGSTQTFISRTRKSRSDRFLRSTDLVGEILNSSPKKRPDAMTTSAFNLFLCSACRKIDATGGPSACRSEKRCAGANDLQVLSQIQ